MPSSGLFTPIFVPDAVADAVSDRAWLQAMLDFEAALATAQGAPTVAEGCRAERFDIDSIGREARASGNPVLPLVTALRDALGDASDDVHRGATSQDVLDSAAMLVARSAVELIRSDLAAVATACGDLADEHRSTLMAGRTLLQQAVPVTFGLKAAGWLVSMLDADDALAGLAFPLQLGGAAGTLAALGANGPSVRADVAVRLGLAEPDLPWHTSRAPVVAIGSALAMTAGALGKIALDVVLLAQTEVGEVSERSGGGSSTMPHKSNPVGSVIARACARRALAACGLVVGASMDQEHERAAGAWHAEWQPFTEALAMTGGAAAAMREVLEGLEVHPDRMRENLARSGDAPMAEAAVFALAQKVGRSRAKEIVDEALQSGSLREGLAGHLPADEIDAVLDPKRYLGSASDFIDRALERYRSS